jgi:excisionase family DNA binding protein
LSRETAVAAAIAEIDRAIDGLRAARKLIAEAERSETGSLRRTRKAASKLRDLRYSGMTVSEAAAALGIGEEHLRRLLRRGELSGVPYGGRIGWRLARDYVAQLSGHLDKAREGREAARRVAEAGQRPVGRPPSSRVGKRKR